MCLRDMFWELFCFVADLTCDLILMVLQIRFVCFVWFYFVLGFRDFAVTLARECVCALPFGLDVKLNLDCCLFVVFACCLILLRLFSW